ncbi:MAG: glycoside hydrolase family 92 protein [Chitinophaga sp.]|uniref:glycoside hydrolase domain-containing protein n=1 Tax=Chitinophaga sp. TaxID=1869181 RepID=UPI0025B9FA50|nr:glycoside hydrolase domain-containing protein [Chitinophaga sp.]MBV8254100.1 glycoside hydrolase family 92 protein [Chitinophaga sp.]
MARYLVLLLWISFLVGCSGSENNQQTSVDVLGFVNPFIGTGNHGHTFPGAAYPSGMVQLSPHTGVDTCAGYHYQDSTITGFSHVQLSTPGNPDVILMPTVGKATGADSRSRFSHDEELASPGYYKVKLKDFDIMAELTVAQHCGMHRYTFPASKESHIVVNFTQPGGRNALQVKDSCTITGRSSIGDNAEMYFVIKVSKPFRAVISAEQQSNAILHFETSDNEMVLVKVGISPASVQQAQENLSAEIPDWDFNEVLTQAQLKWEQELSGMNVVAPAKTKIIFYTALYHSLITPCRVSAQHDFSFTTHASLDSITSLYTDQPDGLPGDDDCGQLSSWYLYSAIGLYLVNPAEGMYLLGKPSVSAASVNVQNRKFTMKATNLSDKNIYVQAVKLNGKDYNKLYITNKDIMEGGSIEFSMGPTPGVFERAVPPSSQKGIQL